MVDSQYRKSEKQRNQEKKRILPMMLSPCTQPASILVSFPSKDFSRRLLPTCNRVTLLIIAGALFPC